MVPHCIKKLTALFGSYEVPCESIFKKFMWNGISWKIWRKWDQPRSSTINGSKVTIWEKNNSKTKVANLSFTLIFVVILSFELFLSQNYNFWTVNRRRSRLVSFYSYFPGDSISRNFFENRFTGSLVRPEQSSRYLNATHGKISRF